MPKPIKIKELAIGEGKPVICVPIVYKTEKEIIEEAVSLADNDVEMIEWRVDWFEKLGNSDEVIKVLQSLREILIKQILLFTYRSKRQGGEGQLTEKEQMALLLNVASSGMADILDVEFFEQESPAKFIKKLQEKGAVVIASHHDFEQTPKTEAMTMILDKMYMGGADIVKLAVMPKSKQDMLRLLTATDNFCEEHPDTPAVTMSMGKYGMLSRLCGEFMGSAITFGSHEKASAPGQIQMKDLNLILGKIHESCMGEL